MLIDQTKVIKKVADLVETMGISKTKLGEVLGKGTDDPRVKIARASRFLNGKKKNVTLREINALAEFFNKSPLWFLFNTEEAFALSASDKQNVGFSLELEKIEDNMRKMGLDDDFIRMQIKQLKAMEAYKINL